MSEIMKTLNLNNALEMCVVKNDLDGVKKYIEDGADVNQTTSGQSVLYYAASNGFWEIVEYLMDSGANVNTANNYNNRFAHQLIEGGSVELLEKALGYGLIVNCYDYDLESPFLSAVKKGRHDMVDFILEYVLSANITSVDKNGKNGLHYCAENNNKDLFLKLWYEGLDISTVDNKGNTPIDYIKDDEWKNELPKIEKEVIEIIEAKIINKELNESVEIKEKSTLKAIGISLIEKRKVKM